MQNSTYHGEFFKENQWINGIKSHIFSDKKFALEIASSKHVLTIDGTYTSFIDSAYDLKVPVWKIEASAHQDKHWFFGILFQDMDLETKIFKGPEFHFYFWEYSKGYEGRSSNITKDIIEGRYDISRRKLHKENMDARFRSESIDGRYFSIYRRLDK